MFNKIIITILFVIFFNSCSFNNENNLEKEGKKIEQIKFPENVQSIID